MAASKSETKIETEATTSADPNLANRVNPVYKTGLLDGNVRMGNEYRNRSIHHTRSKLCQLKQSGLQFGFAGWQRPNQKPKLNQKQPPHPIQIVPIETIRSTIRVCWMATSKLETRKETEATTTPNPNCTN